MVNVPKLPVLPSPSVVLREDLKTDPSLSLRLRSDKLEVKCHLAPGPLSVCYSSLRSI